MAFDRDAEQRAKLTDIISSALVRQGWQYEKGPGWPVSRQFATFKIPGLIGELVLIDIGDIVERLLDAQ